MEMLSAVHQALYDGDNAQAHATVSHNNLYPRHTGYMSDRLRKRLDSLRNDKGANQLILATLAGEVVLKVGDGRNPRQPPSLKFWPNHR
ncbi:MAG: hypothetical protein H6667_24715 [Ardenticatenaceae bacterium]|nr:hypothetical protein [Ardenticatenaceae bacterium]